MSGAKEKYLRTPTFVTPATMLRTKSENTRGPVWASQNIGKRKKIHFVHDGCIHKICRISGDPR
jgi:hypothetical protein